MAKPKQPKQPPEPTKPTLLEALKFIKLAQLDAGSPINRHCVLFGQWAYGFDGILSAGHPIDEDLAVAPLTGKLIQALERADDHMAMVALPSGLSVKAGRFRAVIPCFPLADMPDIRPDPPMTAIDDRLRAGFAAVGPLATEGAQHVITAAIRLGPGTVVATNRHMLIEYWHGIDLPVLLLPKQVVKAIESVKTPLAQFGFSAGSATFYFTDGSWVKTQLYNEKYPNFDNVLNKPSDQWPITPGLFDALRKLKPFIGDAKGVMFSKNLLHTSRNKELEGSCYEVAGLPDGRYFNLEYLLLMENVAKTVDYGTGDTALMFQGDNVRGAISPMRHLNGE